MSIHKTDVHSQLEEMVRSMPGQRLPAERTLCERFSVSRATIRVILQELESRGLVHRRQGSGTYAVDQSSRSLRRITILVDSEIKLEADPFFSSLIDKLQRAMQDDGFECILRRVEAGEVPADSSDAVVLLGKVADSLLAAWENRNLPGVALFADASAPLDSRISVLKWDDQEAGRSTGSRILNSGLQRVCFLGRQEITACRQRFEGLRQALEKSDVEIEFCECRLNYSAGLEAAEQIVETMQDDQLAVVACNDWLALGIHIGLLQRGAGLRERISLFSFDGLEICSDPSMAIESLAIPVDEIVQDTILELRRLTKSPVTRARVIQYSP